MNIRKVAAAQYAPVFLDLEATLDKIDDIAADAATQNVELLVFPETFLPGYPYWTLCLDAFTARTDYYPRLLENSVVIGDATTDRLCKAAKANSMAMVIGLTEREGGTLYNSQLILDKDGSILGCRRKLMPTHHERMSYGFGSGEDLKVYDTSVGRLGALVCYEHSNALFRYAVQSQGEEIHVANWPGGLSWTDNVIDAASRNYAFEAQCFVVSVTGVLPKAFIEELGDKAMEIFTVGGGMSTIVGPNGRIIAKSDSGKEELIIAELDMAEINKAKTIVDSFGHYSRSDVVQLMLHESKPKALAHDLPLK
ncbi:carbon-nitrogen hydrolase family protein [Celeribacter halophilus]|uniref:carbon-nitrogen hydrolase family protein n=1 Tax=Celeribacter halophilus TaxID=576117 RepID=UPI001C091915|nr:carbon-nitrogen hydrolase family protein [Celeribacter halophilus]MBU2889532.1 carbon-nitrogen hydrolase family protein [Celeribacter halophilus]MDO6510827.1 carbon-nitrogen hydrolase family protein [Celeribacter halophilus]